MPKHRFERSEPTHDWQELRTLLTDPTQRTYEIIRPVILGWTTPRERAAETGMPQRTVYHKANLFDQAGMASLLPPSPPPAVPKYARFRDFLLYGERNLAGEKVHINVSQETLAVEYDEQTLAKYSVEWQPDDEHLLRVGNPRLYDHSYQSSQLDLWPQDALEWFVIIKAVPYGSRPRRKRSTRILVIQSPLWTEEA